VPHKKGVLRCALCYLSEKRGNRLSVSLCIYGDALARIRGGGGVRDLRDPLKKRPLILIVVIRCASYVNR